VKPSPSIYDQITAIFSGTYLRERLLEMADEGKLGFWRKLNLEIIRRLPVFRCVVPSYTLFSDGLTEEWFCPPEASRAIAGEIARASLP